MDGEELDKALNDLERQLERLRALYEQYFMGIEKIEPAVPRKDVDRKFWALKRTQIRNTARRFRLNSLFMRYNTLQQRWIRVCREIENGTYARHVARAERRLGSASSAQVETQTADPQEEVGRQDRAQAATDAAADDLAALLESDFDPVEEAKRAMEAALKPSAPSERPERPSLRPAPKRAAKRPTAPLELEDDDLFGESQRPPSPQPRNVSAAPRAPSVAPRNPSAAPARQPASGARASRAPPLPGRQRPAPPGSARASTSPGASKAAPFRAPARPSMSAKPPAVSTRPPSVSARPPAVSARPPAVSARPPAVSARPPAGSTTPSAKPPPARPRPRQDASAIFGTKTHDPLASERVKQLHSKLVATKKQLNQGGNVSLNGLEKQLRASLPKLQQKHRGRQIDFDVVVKDGRAIVKPKVR